MPGPDRSLDELMLKWLDKKTRRPSEIKAKVVLIFSEAGLGKTVLACRLGKRIALITNEIAGSSALTNHPEIEKNVRVIPVTPPESFASKGYWDWVRRMIPLIEEGKFCHYDGEPFDTIVLDTISGMISDEIQQIVKSGVATEKGKVSQEVAGRPDYLVSEQRIKPVLTDIANLERCSVVMLSHQRLGDKLTPGANTRVDAHRAAFQEINKYVSVMAYLKMTGPGKRELQVMPTGNGVAVKSRYHFSDDFVSDDEFVAQIEKWKNQEGVQ
ncbi:AAA family ATPase [Streptomyces sp. NPDC048720]|uniref:AAA family ATPase n=1 Tax=Streptomyces sp. NPDC048720 TaxID=3365588 RepID=UPI003719445D